MDTLYAVTHALFVSIVCTYHLQDPQPAQGRGHHPHALPGVCATTACALVLSAAAKR